MVSGLHSVKTILSRLTFVVDLITECLLLGLIDLGQVLEFGGLLTDQRALVQELTDVVEPILVGEPVDLDTKSVLRNAEKRVLDPADKGQN